MTIITVYEKERCQQCTAAKRHLDSAGAKYEVQQITPEVLDAAKSLGVSSAPILQYGDRVAGGFNPGFLNEVIALQQEELATVGQ